jgi:hypothetical protein
MHIDYTNKPSKPTLVAAIRKFLATGDTRATFQWGENEIEMVKGQWGLCGRGWIGKNGGQDLANAFRTGSAK